MTSKTPEPILLPTTTWEEFWRTKLMTPRFQVDRRLLGFPFSSVLPEVGMTDGTSLQHLLEATQRAAIAGLPVLEIGVAMFKTTNLMSQAYRLLRQNSRVFAIDPNPRVAGHGRPQFWKADSRDPKLWHRLPPDFALIFIDGDHSPRTVILDSMLACTHMVPGGLVLWHDVHKLNDEGRGVCEAVEWWREIGHDVYHIQGSWLAAEVVT